MISLDAAPEDLPALQALPADARLLGRRDIKRRFLRAFRSLAPEDRFLLEGKILPAMLQRSAGSAA